MKKIYLILLLFFITLSGSATHIVGGDITVQHLNGNNFRVSLRFYRDCSAGTTAFDNPIEVGLFDKVTNAIVDSFSLSLTTVTPLSLGDACYAPNVCVEEGLFSANVSIPNNANGYYLSWQRCCRNGIINNIVNPGSQGLVYYVEIPDPAIGNSSPTFGSYTKTYMCNGSPTSINFAATDINGDNLVYSLVTPKDGWATAASPSLFSPIAGPYPNVVWQNPYSLANILGSTPNVSINSTTGVLTVTPTTLGVFVFAVKVEEYRAGVKIGEITRDIQYQVISCTNPLTPGPAQVLSCSNSPVVISAISSGVVSSYSWSGPGVVSGGNTANASVNLPGTYTVTTTSPTACTYTATVSVTSIVSTTNVTAGSSLALTCQNPSGTINASSSTPGATYSWSGPGITSGINTSSPTVNAAGTYTVAVTNPSNGCSSTAVVSVTGSSNIPNLSTSSSLTLNCITTSGTISAASSTAGVNFLWSGPGIVSGAATPTPTINSGGTYTVTVTNPNNGCSISSTLVINQNTTLPDVKAPLATVITCNNPTSTVTVVAAPSNVTYNWSGAGIISGGSSSNMLANATGTYTVAVTDPTNGCSKTATVTIVDNRINPTISTGSNLALTCPSPSGTISVSSSTAGVTYLWAGSGIVANGSTANATVNIAGTYTVTVSNPSNGCTSSGTVTVTGNSALPNVSASSSLLLNCTTTSGIVNANSSTSGVTYSWAGPGIVSGGTSTAATINLGGTYVVTVTNSTTGCTSSASVVINQNTTKPNVSVPNASIITCSSSNSIINVSSSTSGVNYSWSGPGVISGATSSSPTVNATGTYTVVVTNPANGCTNTTTVNVTNNITTPNVSAGSTLTLTCGLTSSTISASSSTVGAGFQWYGPSITANSNSNSPTVNAIGTYTVVVTNTSNGCTSSATVLVNNNISTPNVAGGNSLVLNCSAGSGIITASSSTSNVSYAWAGPNITAGGLTSSATVNAAGTYTVVVTNPVNNCTNSATVLVSTDLSIPDISATSSLTLTCNNVSDTIFATSSVGSVTYSWVGPGILSGANGPSPIVNTGGTYTVTIVNPGTGCSNLTTVNVINNVISPTITAGPSLILTCAAPSNTISVNSATSGLTYTWSGAGIVSGSTTAIPIVNAAGTYTVTVTNPANSCTSSTTVSVTNNKVNPNVIAGSTLTLTCRDTTGTISANSTTPNADFVWSGTGIIANGNTASPTVDATGTYTVTVTDPVNGCTSIATVAVNDNIVVPNLVAGTPLVLTCSVGSGVISASSITSNVSYAWSGPNIVSGGSSSSATVNASGMYTVVITNTINGCTSSGTVQVSSDNSIPNLSATSSLTLTCSNVTDTIFAVSSTSNVTYVWSGPGIVSGITSANPIVSAAGTYTVVATSPTSGCTSLTTVNVINNIIDPSLTVGLPLTLNCLTLSDTISATSTTAGVLYNWSGSSILSGGTTSTPLVGAAGTYTVVITNPQNSCTSSATIVVTNNNTAPNVTAGASITLTCALTSNSITANSTTSGVSYSWSGAGILSGITTSSPIVNVAGTYTVTVTDSINGCTSSATILVNNNVLIPDVLGGNDLILTCNISSGSVSANSTTSGATYFWSGVGIVSGGNTSTPTLSMPGTYTVTVTNPINGCTNSTTLNVTNAPVPVASVNASASVITLGNSTTLMASGGVTYSWSPSSGLSCTTCASPLASPFVTTTYCVIATDQYGCSDTACVKINVYDPCPLTNDGFIVPNIFSPNGDNANDVLLLKDWNKECISDFAFEIYDRWGLKMFEALGTDIHWDGRTASGLECPAGTYYYIVSVKKVRAEAQSYKGFITLVR